MSLSIDKVQEICAAISRQVSERFKNLAIHYVVHQDGRRKEALAMAAEQLMHHDAADTAMQLLTHAKPEQESSLIGVAVARQHIFMGLASRDSLLALCSINVNQYQTLKEARRHAYHLAWHAIDAWHYHGETATRLSAANHVIIRKRNALEISNANMQADTFATMMSVLQGDRETTEKLSAARGLAALQAYTANNPERYPFVIARDAAAAALDDLGNKTVGKRRLIDVALKKAEEISKTFDKDATLQWIEFAEPAQQMAWRHYSPAQILSAAINTSEDTSVRSIGYLVADVTGIAPTAILDIDGMYSPFADDSFNEKLHDKAIHQTFEDVIAEGLRQNSALPFLEAARQQNQDLVDGHVLGWCAGALQMSGRAFGLALESGRDAEATARREFKSESEKTTWEGLRDLGKKIIDSCRQGEPPTLAKIITMDKDNRGVASLRRSIEMTLKEQALQKTAAPGPAAPTPAMPAPARTMAYAGPGMGRMGMGAGRVAAAARTVVVEKKVSESTDTGSTEQK